MTTTGEFPSRCLWVGPDLTRAGGAAAHLRQLLLHMRTQHMGFASFGDVVDTDIGKRMTSLSLLGHRGWPDYPRTIRRLARFLNSQRPRAIVAFGPQPLIVTAAALRATGIASGLGYVEISRPLTAARIAQSGLRGRINIEMLRRALSRVHVATANSGDGLDELVKLSTSSCKHLRLVRNPIDLRAWNDSHSSRNEGPQLRILTTSRLVPTKGVSQLIEAVARLATRFPFTLAIAGEGPQRVALENQASELGIRDRVHFLGWVGDLPSEMRRADIFVFPSHYEGFPNSLLEALASATPVVSSFWGAEAKKLHDSGAVLGFAPGDVAALTKALTEVLGSVATRDRLAKHGRCYAEAYGVETVVGDYDLLFHDLDQIAS